MMKKLKYKLAPLLTFLLIQTILVSQTFTDITPANIPGIKYGSVDCGDFDNDGDFDLLFRGNTADSSITRIFENKGNFIFEELTGTDFISVKTGKAGWCDYNGDGLLDFYIVGGYYVSFESIFKIYRNDGNKQFTMIEFTGMLGAENGDIDMADIDNDGDIDIFATGWVKTGPNFAPAIPRLFENLGNDEFGVVENTTFHTVLEGAVSLDDYDNDGDNDIFYSGWEGMGEYGPVTKIYKNEGDNIFTEDTTTFIQALNGDALELEDYDQDGDLDVLTVGSSHSWLYDNSDGKFTENVLAGLWAVDGGCAKWGDYDNDGDLDIILTSAAVSSRNTYLYENNSDGTFTEYGKDATNLHDFDYSKLTWADLDNDKDLDLVILGGSSTTVKIYRNDILTANTLPSPPTNLVSTVDADSVILSWDSGSDSETQASGLSYNLYISDSKGDVLSPMADKNTGKRKIVTKGNASQNLFWKSNSLKFGEYFWSIQSIDNAFEGSSFAVQDTFIVPPTCSFNISSDTIFVTEILKIEYTGNVDTNAIFNWDFDNGVVISDSLKTIEVFWEELGEKQISLSITIDTLTTINNTKNVIIVQPTSSFKTSADTLCIYENLGIQYTGNAPPDATFDWNFENGIIVSDTLGLIEVMWEDLGEKEISLSVNFDTISSDITSKLIFINPIPAVELSGDTLVGVNDTAFLYFSFDGTPPFKLYYSHNTDTNIVWVNDFFYTSEIYDPGIYRVIKLENTYGCNAIELGDSVIVSLATFINEYENGRNITVYPNPANKILNINFDDQVCQIKIDITNISGNSLFSFSSPNYVKEISIPLDLDAGIYLIRIMGADYVYVKKLIIK